MAIVETIAGSVLGSVLQVLLDKLASLGLEYAKRRTAPPFSGISAELLNEWKKKLVKINALLDDAEDKQLRDSRLVKLWLDEVRDLAYDMEDMLDELAIQAAEVKSAAKSSKSRGWVNWKVSCSGGDKSSSSNLNPRSFIPEIRVQEINRKFEQIFTETGPLNLKENAMGRTNYINKRPQSTCQLETQFFGRQKEEEEIVKVLTGEDISADATLSIVPIIGMGGIGKTALAQRLYNNANVSSCFEMRAWVCVSDVFDVLVIIKSILQSITELPCEDKDLNWLQNKLTDSLSGKKFLVVLDDVWNKDYDKWSTLLKPFEVGAKGSKIIVTARNRSAIFERGVSPYALEELPLNYCTSLLAFNALRATNFEGHPDLERIGKKIARKCKGLPLAAKMLGGALCNERNPDKWEAILNNKIWDLPRGKNDEVLPVLKLSYFHLPSYLKRCFAYCAVYPKDYEIERDELVFLWIAGGFLDGQKAEKDILRLGRDYFDELVSRSFLQQSRVNASKFSMHDLLNDLANSIAVETCFSSWESWVVGNKDDASLEKVRYASFSSSYVTSKSMSAYHGMKVLRSLMLLTNRPNRKIYISNKVLRDLLKELKYLRAFSLCHCYTVEVPNCVGELKHLRYLNFSYTAIKSLPDSIGGLCKLQALILRGCRQLSVLPPGLTKLVSLQFLDIRETKNLKEMPLGMSYLENLTLLSKFVVGPKKGSQLKELQNLPHLEGELLISKLQKVEEVGDVAAANLSRKKGLSNLFLRWDEDFGNLLEEKHESQVLRYLQPHTNLLRDCRNVETLPSLGQLPSLKELSLEGLHAIRMIGSEVYGRKSPFTSLTTLKFEEMLAWKDWSPYANDPEEEAPFSCLQHLVIRSCPSLVGTLPCQFDRLIKLEIHSCTHLDNSTSVARLPSLRELDLVDCNKEILKSLVNLTSLTILRIENLGELVCFDHGYMSGFVKLKVLRITRCEKLTYLWQQDGNEMLNLTCLEKLAIESCPRFTSFLAGEGEMELPCNLGKMDLRDCESLEKLPSKMHTLRNLWIENCPKIMGVNIPRDGPSSNNPMFQLETLTIEGCKGVESLEEITVAEESLKSLYIWRCENLRSLPRCLHALSSLTSLDIRDCPALEVEEDFPPLPHTLSTLTLYNCPKIKSIANCLINSCNNLTKLYIWECRALEMEEFPPLPINLSHFSLYDCPKIKALPNQWHHLTSLQSICISTCHSIECFPKGGFPSNLRSLEIRGCENVKQPVRDWGLLLLTSLQCLTIGGRSMGGGEGEEACFPSEEDAWSLLFPSSLTCLWIENMKKVERLSSGLRNHLSSLTHLWIQDCPELRYLPEDGLPPSKC